MNPRIASHKFTLHFMQYKKLREKRVIIHSVHMVARSFGPSNLIHSASYYLIRSKLSKIAYWDQNLHSPAWK